MFFSVWPFIAAKKKNPTVIIHFIWQQSDCVATYSLVAARLSPRWRLPVLRTQQIVYRDCGDKPKAVTVVLPQSSLRLGVMLSSFCSHPCNDEGINVFPSTQLPAQLTSDARSLGDTSAAHSGHSFQRWSVWLSARPPVRITPRPAASGFGTSLPTN